MGFERCVIALKWGFEGKILKQRFSYMVKISIILKKTIKIRFIIEVFSFYLL